MLLSSSADEFYKIIKQILENCPKHELGMYIESMPSRIKAVIRAKVWHFK